MPNLLMRSFSVGHEFLVQVIGNYKVQLYDPNTKGYGDYPNIGMHVEVKDPEDKVIVASCFICFREIRVCVCMLTRCIFLFR